MNSEHWYIDWDQRGLIPVFSNNIIIVVDMVFSMDYADIFVMRKTSILKTFI